MNMLVTEARRLLEALGVNLTEGDGRYLELCAERVTEEICGRCNSAKMPEGLLHAAAGWAAAKFLEGKKSMGMLEGLEGFDYEAAVQQIQEGDTSVRYFDHPSAEQRLERLITRLKPSDEQLAAYRRLKW